MQLFLFYFRKVIYTMKMNKKVLLTVGIMSALAVNVYANDNVVGNNNTVAPSNVLGANVVGNYNNVPHNSTDVTVIGNSNNINAESNVVGAANTINPNDPTVHYEGKNNVLGSANEIKGTSNVVVGNGVHATGSLNVLVGSGTRTKTSDDQYLPSVTIGYNAATNGNSIAVGSFSEANDGSVALGSQAHAEKGAIAIGTGVYTNGYVEDVDPDKWFKQFTGSELTVNKNNMIAAKFGGRNGQKAQLQGIAPGKITYDSDNAVTGAQLWYVAEQASKHVEVKPATYHDEIEVTTSKDGNDGHTIYGLKIRDGYVQEFLPSVEASTNINVFKSRQFNTYKDEYYVSLSPDLKYMNSIEFNTFEDMGRHTMGGVEENGNTSSMDANNVSFYNGKNEEGSALTSHSLEMNSSNNSMSLASTGLTFSNDIEGNISQVSPNGFATETKDGKHLEFSSDAIMAGDQQIHDVAKGTEDTDAVNVSQLKEVESKITGIGSNVVNQAKSYTDQQVGRVGAASAALSALHPLDYNPDHKTDIMAGVGHYKGKTAAALGVAYRPNENTMLTFGATVGDRDTMLNAGVSYKVGAKDSTYRSPASMAKDIDDLKAIVAKLVKENADLKTSLNK